MNLSNYGKNKEMKNGHSYPSKKEVLSHVQFVWSTGLANILNFKQLGMRYIVEAT